MDNMQDLKVGDYVRFIDTDEEDERIIMGYCGIIREDHNPKHNEYRVEFLAPFPENISRYLTNYEDDFWVYPECLEIITEEEAMLWKLQN